MLLWIPLALLLLTGAFVSMVLTRLVIDKRRAFAWTLAVAAERGIPLEEVARASAVEYGGMFGTRLSRLANLLASGIPLSEALGRASIKLPPETQLSLELTNKSPRLPQLLQRLVGASGEAEGLIRSLQERLAYVLLIATLLLLGISLGESFLGVKIYPAISWVIQDFAMEQQHAFVWMVTLSDYFLWLAWIPLFLGLACFSSWLMLLLHYSGIVDLSWMLWKTPLLNRLAPLTDRMLILNSLAEEVRQGQPLTTAFAGLADLYPKRHLRVRLDRVAARASAGGDPWLNLAQAKLLDRQDIALLRSSQRAGNLPWALEQTSERYLRRRVRRSQWLITVAYPVMLLAFGVIVGLIAGLMMMNIMGIAEALAL